MDAHAFHHAVHVVAQVLFLPKFTRLLARLVKEVIRRLGFLRSPAGDSDTRGRLLGEPCGQLDQPLRQPLVYRQSRPILTFRQVCHFSALVKKRNGSIVYTRLFLSGSA